MATTKQPTETREQQYVIKWSQQPSVRKQYPCLKLLYHVANERNCSLVQGKQLKLAGVKPGIPDLHLPVPNKKYHGLFIEMKRAKGGMVSDNQKWWLAELTNKGYKAVVAHGWIEATNIIMDYLKED